MSTARSLHSRVGWGLIIAALTAGSCLRAQQQLVSHIGYVYPAGGKQGSTFQVKIGGQLLDGVTNAMVSGAGIEAAVVEFEKPLTQGQFNNLRDQLKELQERRTAAMRSNFKRKRDVGSAGGTNVVWTSKDEQTMAEIRKKMSTFVRRPLNPAIAETAVVQVKIPPDAEPGPRELRLATRLGLSNPLVFYVGQLPEVVKKEYKPSEQTALKAFRNRENQEAVPPSEMSVTLPATINGQILAGGVDRYKFFARRGQQLVAVVRARELVPYLPDAVPGWFQATLKLSDAKGKEVAYVDDYRFHPDPVIHYEVPRDGEYTLEIQDAIFRGREDFVYRVDLGELPFITGIFPLGCVAGETASISLTGWNLPCTSIVEKTDKAAAGVRYLSVRKGEWVSNRVPFAVAPGPEGFTDGANTTRETAQSVDLPTVLNGRIEKPGQSHVFKINGRAGEQIVAEVMARRLDSPLDSTLRLTDAQGRQLAFNDDFEDKGSGLNTHHADAYVRASFPSNGTYYVWITDAQRAGGPKYGYRLRLSEPQPDFALRVTPSGITARPGIGIPITVYAVRKDGFTNGIALRLQDAPPGFSLSGAWIPPGQDKVRLTLSGSMVEDRQPIRISMEGYAAVAGRTISRQAVPADDLEQAFAYHHLVPAQDLLVQVAVGPASKFVSRSGGFKVLGQGPVSIPVGGTATVRLSGPAWVFADRVQLELDQPPEGIEVEKISSGPAGAEIVFKAASKVTPGLRGNLIVGIIPGGGEAAKKAKKSVNNPRRAPMGALPAIPFEIVAR